MFCIVLYSQAQFHPAKCLDIYIGFINLYGNKNHIVNLKKNLTVLHRVPYKVRKSCQTPCQC